MDEVIIGKEQLKMLLSVMFMQGVDLAMHMINSNQEYVKKAIQDKESVFVEQFLDQYLHRVDEK